MKYLLTLLMLLGLATAQAGSLKTVVIDAGHGGYDIGGHNGKVYEKWLTLDTALRLERILKKKGYRTVMTRRSDNFISLSRRTAIGNRYSKAIFVSIHFNQASRREACGFETFYNTGKSKPLAKKVQSALMDHFEVTDRGVKYARFYVIRHSNIPAILVEGGFISNKDECDRIKEGWFREALAKGIADGIKHYD